MIKLLGGALLDRLNKNVVMGFFGLGAGLSTLVIPFCVRIEVLACVIAVSGAFISAYEAGEHMAWLFLI